MIEHIRPHKIFELAPSSNVTLPIPRRRGVDSGTLSLLENFLLIAAARSVGAKQIFEFGTCLGTTTLNLLMNTDAKVLTLDLGAPIENQHPDDAVLTEIHLRGSRDYSGTPYESRVEELTGDSTKFDYSSFVDSIDFVFVDGGHDFDTVKSDTENAFRLVKKNGPACIAWHDYGHPRYPEVTSFLDQFSAERTLFHVGDTMLCFWFRMD